MYYYISFFQWFMSYFSFMMSSYFNDMRDHNKSSLKCSVLAATKWRLSSVSQAITTNILIFLPKGDFFQIFKLLSLQCYTFYDVLIIENFSRSFCHKMPSPGCDNSKCPPEPSLHLTPSYTLITTLSFQSQQMNLTVNSLPAV